MQKILRDTDDVKLNVIALLRRNADQVQIKGDLARAQRFHEGADFLKIEVRYGRRVNLRSGGNSGALPSQSTEGKVCEGM